MDPLEEEEEYMTILKGEVVGREKDKDEIIEILQRRAATIGDKKSYIIDPRRYRSLTRPDPRRVATINEENDGPLFISIEGSKLVGKTTVARLIYHDTWVRHNFHHRIWVDVDVNSCLNLTNMIIREFQRSIIKAGEASERVCELKPDVPLQAAWELINEQLGGSRYFLVLDCRVFPIRNREEWDGWNRILSRVGGQGSAILMTHTPSDWIDFKGTYVLKGLSDQHAWLKLFLRHHDASACNTSEQRKLFQLENAKHLFQECRGSPFWAKYRYHVRWNSFESEDDAIPPIYTRAFHNLSLFLGKPNPGVILHMLTADGTVLDFTGDIDEIYDEFRRRKWLVQSNEFDLIEIVDKISEEFWPTKWRSEEDKFNPNSQSKNEAIAKTQYLQVRVGIDSRVKIPRQCRHLCLVLDSKARAFRLPTVPVEVSSKLRTLILQDDETVVTRISKVQMRPGGGGGGEEEAIRTTKMLAKLVHLQTLYLETNVIRHLPREVSKLVNLRCLHISKNKMEFLPESLCSLTNLLILSLFHCQKLQMLPERIHALQKLQILELVHCTKLRKLPELVTRLKNLKELNVEGCFWLMELPEDLSSMQTLRVLNVARCASLSLPHGMQKMINLRKLSGICIEAGLSNGSFGLKELQALTNLEEIRLRNLERVSKTEEQTRIESLWMIQRLQYVSLHWDNDMSACEPTTSLQILEAFEFNAHLKSIEIISYMGMQFPSWMGKEISLVHSLVEIRLVNLKNCTTLPPLWQLVNLKKLEISGMDSLKEVNDVSFDLERRFRRLEEITFSEMLALEKLSISNYFKPKLRELTLIQCPKLNSFDMNIWVLCDTKLNLWLNMEPWWSRDFSGWECMKYVAAIEIAGCHELRYLPEGMQNSTSLKRLKIMSCNNLVALPEWLANLDSLLSLHIYDCPKLSYIPERIKTHFPGLQIKDCPKLRMQGATN